MKYYLRFLTIILACSLIVACQSPENKAQQRVAEMKKSYEKDTSKVFNKAKASALLTDRKSVV